MPHLETTRGRQNMSWNVNLGLVNTDYWCGGIAFNYDYCLVVFGGFSPATPKNDGRIVSWDDYSIPKWMESHKIPWFQSPPTRLKFCIPEETALANSWMIAPLPTTNHSCRTNHQPVAPKGQWRTATAAASATSAPTAQPHWSARPKAGFPDF